MAEYLVHKPVDLAKVKAKRRKELSEPGYLDATYAAMPKYDGCCAIIHIDMSGGAPYDIDKCVTILTRTGETVLSMDHIKQQLVDHFAAEESEPRIVLFAEAWATGYDFATLSGMFRRHSNSPALGVKVWDGVSAEEYAAGYSDEPFRLRFESILYSLPEAWAALYLQPGSYGYAEWLARSLVDAGGYDGLMLADPEGHWVKGSGTGGEKIKVKPSLSFSLLVVGTEQGKGKHANRIGNLIVRYKAGKPLGVGTGLSDADRERDDWVGKVVEVEAMGHSNDGSLREPRLKGVRTDAQPDF